jgi:hypothetical protein
MKNQKTKEKKGVLVKAAWLVRLLGVRSGRVDEAEIGLGDIFLRANTTNFSGRKKEWVWSLFFCVLFFFFFLLFSFLFGLYKCLVEDTLFFLLIIFLKQQ